MLLKKCKRYIAVLVAATFVCGSIVGCGSATASADAETATESAMANISVDSGVAGITTDIDASGVDYTENVVDGKTTIHVACDMDPGTYDPTLFGSVLGLEETGYCFREGLFERDSSGNLIPQIAKSYTVDDDNLTYHVELYPNVHDSEGNAITAEDVVFCYERAKENGFNSTGYYDSVTADDDTHVTIKLNDSSDGIFAQVAQVILIYSEAFYESCGDAFGSTAETSVFTGPYKLTSWVSGTSLTFEKNENYWQDADVAAENGDIYAVQNVDVIEFDIVSESTQLSIGLQTGTLDMVGNMSYNDAKQFMDGGEYADGYTVTPWEDLLSQVLYLNMDESSPFYDNEDLRKAVMYCIDIDDMIDGCLDGYGVACKTFGNSMMPDYQTAWDSEDYFDYDYDAAQQYAKDSGYTGTLKILCNNSSLHQQMAQIIQGYLQAIGIDSEILDYDDSLFATYKYDPSQYDICLDQVAWSGDSVTKWRDQFDENNAQGCINSISDEEFMDLLHTAMDVTTYSADSVNAFHQYLKEQCYARGLFNATNFCVSKDIVTSVLIHRSGNLFPTGCEFVWNTSSTDSTEETTDTSTTESE